MSRWFPDFLNVRVSAESLDFELTANKHARQWRRTLLRDGERGVSVVHIRDTLEAALSEIDEAGLSIAVTLQAPWVRYCVVPWNNDFTKPSDRLNFVQHCFVQTYADAARGWTVQASRPSYGRAALGAAVDAELLDGLSRCTASRNFRLHSVRCDLAERIEQARATLKTETFWFVLIDASSYSVLLMHNGAPLLVQIAGRREGNLETLLERAWRSTGLEEERCRVFVDLEGSSPNELSESRLGWKMERLPRVLPSTAARSIRPLSKVTS